MYFIQLLRHVFNRFIDYSICSNSAHCAASPQEYGSISKCWDIWNDANLRFSQSQVVINQLLTLKFVERIMLRSFVNSSSWEVAFHCSIALSCEYFYPRVALAALNNYQPVITVLRNWNLEGCGSAEDQWKCFIGLSGWRWLSVFYQYAIYFLSALYTVDNRYRLQRHNRILEI